jgi:hypothetical protein
LVEQKLNKTFLRMSRERRRTHVPVRWSFLDMTAAFLYCGERRRMDEK